MAEGITLVAGIPIPSTSPVFLAVVAVHVLLGLTCVVSGAVAMLSRKGRGRHSDFGTVYVWALAAVFGTSSGLALVRWSQDYPLFILGGLSLTAAVAGREALRRRVRNWARAHIAGMGCSYVLLLTAFYVDNGKNLPLWRELPQVAFWLLPAAVGLPIVAYAMARHPLVTGRRTLS